MMNATARRQKPREVAFNLLLLLQFWCFLLHGGSLQGVAAAATSITSTKKQQVRLRGYRSPKSTRNRHLGVQSQSQTIAATYTVKINTAKTKPNPEERGLNSMFENTSAQYHVLTKYEKTPVILVPALQQNAAVPVDRTTDYSTINSQEAINAATETATDATAKKGSPEPPLPPPVLPKEVPEFIPVEPFKEEPKGLFALEMITARKGDKTSTKGTGSKVKGVSKGTSSGVVEDNAAREEAPKTSPSPKDASSDDGPPPPPPTPDSADSEGIVPPTPPLVETSEDEPPSKPPAKEKDAKDGTEEGTKPARKSY
mgnify:CR=1 FL=1